jgi:hypothetical protein
MTDFVFQIPPKQYDQRYMNFLVRDLRLAFSNIESLGPEVVATLSILNCPTTGAGLNVGDVYVDGLTGVLKLVLKGYGYLASNLLSSALGTATASVS